MLKTTYLHLRRYQEVVALLVETEALLVEALRMRKEMLGDQFPDTLFLSAALGDTYLWLQRYQEAEVPLAEALKIRKEMPGVGYPDILALSAALGGTYFWLQRYHEAEVPLAQALKLRREMP